MTGDGGRTRELTAALADVESRLAAACAAAGRPREDVLLLAVTKTWPLSDVQDLAALGLADFAENRDAEAADKARALPGVRWHFVGQVQTNKAASVASYADVVHALDRPSLARALSKGAVRSERTVDVLVQVALDSGTAKGRGGALPDAVPELADLAAGLPGLRLAGVMGVAPLGADPAPAFARLADVARRLQAAHPDATAVSAGMSGDLEQAVAAGSTIVRVGTALLGRRSPPGR